MGIKNFIERMGVIMMELKKPRKIILVSCTLVAVICCIVVLWGNSLKEGASPNDLSQGKSILTWEAVKALVNGELTYQELYDTYYYKNIGLGFYIISFPIEDTEPYSLTVWFASDMNEHPMAVRLKSENDDITVDLNEENLVQMMRLK